MSLGGLLFSGGKQRNESGGKGSRGRCGGGWKEGGDFNWDVIYERIKQMN